MDEEEQKAAEEAAAREAAEAAAAEAAKKAGTEGKTPEGSGANDAAKEELEQLRKDLETARAEAAKFKGIDPEVAKANAKKVADAETAQRDAEKKAAEAEGNFEKLRQIQKEEQDAALDAERTARSVAEERAAAAEKAVSAMRVRTAFASSAFIATETILTGAKAERLYSDHVEDEDGQIVVYDKPSGEAKRAKVMDGKGNPLPFNEAIAKVIGADPDKDALLKSKMKPGGGSKTEDDKREQRGGGDRLSRLAAGVAKLREGK